MIAKERIEFIDGQLNSFKDSLKLYQEQTKTWYARAADKGSRAADLPSLLGMERVIKVGNTSKSVSMTDGDFTSNVAQCPLKGPLLIESKFESVYDIPVGDIEVEIVAVEGGAVSKVKLDAKGKASWTGGIPGKYYKIRVHNEVTPAQIDALFNSYKGITADLEGFLRKEWAGFKPQWSTLSASTMVMSVGKGILEGGWEAIKGVWDGISLVLDILQDPGKFKEDLGAGTQKLIDLAKQSPEVMKKAMLLASDEAALFLLVRSAVIWLAGLPPTKLAGESAKMTTAAVVGIAIDIVIGIVLTIAAEGTGIIYLVARLKKYGEILVKAVIGFVESVFKIIKGFMEYVAKYTAVAARGVTAKVRNGISELRFDGKRVTTVETPKGHHDAPAQSKTPDGKSANCAKSTCTNGCPVSMVTGEELLTLTDGELFGLMPFVWTRLYRTSAAEIDCGLGYGWSHALAQRVEVFQDEVVWTDHENRVITFPLPSEQRPTITNSLSEAAIFIGDTPSEIILTQAGERSQFYHFHYNNSGATLIAISDKYDNRLHVTRDIQGRIKRIDNGAGRGLLLRYDRKHIIAVDYQQFLPADNLEDAWNTVQTLVTYSYDAQNRLIEAKNTAGEAERYAYNEQNVILERHLAGGAIFYWEWERKGKSARCIHHWSNFSQMDTHYLWDDKGSVTVTNADGSEEVYTHDEQARLIAQIDPDGAENLKAYDENGRLIAERDPLGAITEYRYNTSGRLVAVVPPEDEPTSYEYSNGFVTKISRGKSTWKYERNNQGDVTRQIDPDGHATLYSYDRQGRLLEITHPDGSRHQLGWNNLGQLLEERLPDGGQRKYRYDAMGRQITRQEESGAITHYQWNNANRLSQVTLPGGVTRAFTYNAYGRVTAERDELGRITRYEYADNLHLVSRRINPDGSQLRYR
uniref:DUF6531 domain-containing protein n=1 Tax=Pseudomonas sp. B11(2017) TaxID=1981748 RepID=UPI00111C844E